MFGVEQAGALQLAQARRYMRALARFWCGGSRGRSKLDPTYVEVTEGRDTKTVWNRYSSCGDLSQALAFHMGAREAWVNRKEYLGWRPGQNLTAFYGKGGPARSPSLGYLPEAGDIGFIWLTGFDAHTFVFGDPLPGGLIETFNYGAGGMQAVHFPGARMSHSPLRADGGKLHVGAKVLHEVCTVPQLLERCGTLPDISNDATAELESRVLE